MFHGAGYVIRDTAEGQDAHPLQEAQRVGHPKKIKASNRRTVNQKRDNWEWTMLPGSMARQK
jgi:hypothetical protein